MESEDKPPDNRKANGENNIKIKQKKRPRFADEVAAQVTDDDVHDDTKGESKSFAPIVPIGEEDGQDEEEDEEDAEARTIFGIRMSILRQSYALKHEEEDKEKKEPLGKGRGSVLEERLQDRDIERMYKAFIAAPNHQFNQDEFRQELANISGIQMTDDEFEVIYMKMDSKRDGLIDWDEFLSHILLEVQEKDMVEVKQELHQPLEGYPRVLKTNHRLPVVRVTFFPAMQADRTTSFLRGKYVTVSRDGMVHYWSLDFDMEDTMYSKCPLLRIRPTWVTDLVCMPDVNIVCTCSTERDLRFYDVTARKFDLRMLISSLPSGCTCMGYYFPPTAHDESHLLVGDMGGSVRVFSFLSAEKGPFAHKAGSAFIHKRFRAVLKGGIAGMKVAEFRGIHGDWVRQVGYYVSMSSFVSCAPASSNSLYLCDVHGSKTKYSYNVAKGITCFTTYEETHIIATGGPDCVVRVWNAFVPQKASSVFQGHHTCIVSIVIQEAGRRLYSMSKDKCIKVWDVPAQTCVQTYLSMPPELGERTPLVSLYNPLNRNLVVACNKIAILVLGMVVDEERTDGFTHTKAVVRALYNPLFKCLVTVGLDSIIMVWDPWLGKRMFLLRNAHTRMYYGYPKPVEITAATFDPSYQLLLTGARDGSLKVWNFNTGTCMRTMAIESYCEVTSVVWLRNRILAVGWNRHVTEFADTGVYVDGKMWETRHTDDVLCIAVRENQTLATSSYCGELILWRLETGQAYRRYSVINPFARILLTYTSEHEERGRKSILEAGQMYRKRRRRSRAHSRVDTHGGSRASSESEAMEPTFKSSGSKSSHESGNITSRVSSVKSSPDNGTDTDTSGGAYKPTDPLDAPHRRNVRASQRLSKAARPRKVYKKSEKKLEKATRTDKSLSVSQSSTEEEAEVEVVITTQQKTRRHSREAVTIQSALASARRVSVSVEQAQQQADSGLATTAPPVSKRKARRVSVIQMPVTGGQTRPLSVHAMLFLQTRPMRPDYASLFVAIDNGFIQVWSHHSGGGYLTQFLSIHMAGDYVCSMTSDPQNNYLITGTTMGYIKIWLMINYGIPPTEEVHVCMPLLRLQFPFLWHDRIEGRAKRSLRDQKWPLLLSSYRAHLMAVNYLQFLEDNKIIISCSSDTTVRFWTLGGRYIGTLGSLQEWRQIHPNIEPVWRFRIPPDIQRVGSSSTMKVLKGGDVPRTHFKLVDDSDLLKDLPRRLLQKATYGKRASSPMMGKFFRLPRRTVDKSKRPEVDLSNSQIPVFCHLQTPEFSDLPKIKAPEIVARNAGSKSSRRPPKPQKNKISWGVSGPRPTQRQRKDTGGKARNGKRPGSKLSGTS